MELPDIQKTEIDGTALDKVGVKNIKLPLRIYQKDGDSYLQTVAEFSLYTWLSGKEKGTHMSRFTEVLYSHALDKQLNCDDLVSILRELSEKLKTPLTYLEVMFDYFLPRPSPVTGKKAVAPFRAGFRLAYLDYDAVTNKRGIVRCVSVVEVTGQTCCPCSKEISDYDKETGRGKGAHSQRGKVTIEAVTSSHTLLETLIEVAESSMSAPSYPLLKRPDERHATISAYENPCFVEDVLRRCYDKLRVMPSVDSFFVSVENFEVIHFHNAYGEVSFKWRK